MANEHPFKRRRSLRLVDYDYRQAGAYFVTICTDGRQCSPATIVSSEAVPSAIGSIVAEQWEMIPTRFPGVELDVFVVMPNHLHGILVLPDFDDTITKRPSLG